MSQEQLNNKLKRFKFTKPEIFRSSLIETSGERQKSRPWHDKKNDLTDYFNHGFNEHTLQIYAQKVTKMCEKYNNEANQEKYVEIFSKLNQGNELERLFSRSWLAKKEIISMDLGGLSYVVDKKLLKIQDPLSLFFEPKHNEYQGMMMEQYLCKSDQILYQNTKMNDIKRKMEERIQSLYKKSTKKGLNLYLFDESSKILPHSIRQANQFMNPFPIFPDNMLMFPFTQFNTKIPNIKNQRNQRSRSRENKKSSISKKK